MSKASFPLHTLQEGEHPAETQGDQRTLAALKERYAGQMDFVKASALVKQHLG